MQSEGDSWPEVGLNVPDGHGMQPKLPLANVPAGHIGRAHTTLHVPLQSASFHCPGPKVFTHNSPLPELLGFRVALNEQYPMQLPAVVMPLKNGAMPGVDRFIAHWNWLELLLYGIRRVPAVHATTEAPAMVDTNAFWHELKMAGSVPFLEAQNANASVQFSDTPEFQYMVAPVQPVLEFRWSGHAEHFDEPMLENVPSAHGEQNMFPPVENVLAGQQLQTAVPFVELYVPPGQGKHPVVNGLVE